MNYIHRHLEHKLQQMSQHFKVILLTGARQVGKSTLLTNLFPDIKHITLDPVQDLYNAQKDPDLFLSNFPPPLILDEIQYAPNLLASLKRKVDMIDNNGLYFLTGSQNLNVLTSVAESMAGRVGVLHLDNMSLHEFNNINHLEQTNWLSRYLDNPKNLLLSTNQSTISANLLKTLWTGSLPGLLNIPQQLIHEYFSSYMQTYVERDIRQLENIQDLHLFSRFVGICAALSAQEINFSHLGREIGVTPKTAEKWLSILINTYQWRSIPAFSNNSVKKVSQKNKGYFCDTGFICYLQRISSPDALVNQPQMGHIFETWVVNQIHKLSSSLLNQPKIHHWRLHSGAEVDLVLEQNGKLYPIEIKYKSQIKKDDLRGLKSFRQTYTNSHIENALIVYAGNEVLPIDNDTIAIPWNFI